MRILTISLFLLLSSSLQSETSKIDPSAEEQQLREIHFQCSRSQKSSANCHEDMMKACDLKESECLQLMEDVQLPEKKQNEHAQ